MLPLPLATGIARVRYSCYIKVHGCNHEDIFLRSYSLGWTFSKIKVSMILFRFAYITLITSFFISLVYSTPTSVLKYSAGHLHIPIKKVDNLSKRKLQRRKSTEIDLQHESGIYYSAILEIGTSHQELPVLFDSGSSDMWVSSSANPYCLESEGYVNQTYNGETVTPFIDCKALGTFDYNGSSSFERLDIGRFYIKYSDESFADGFWAKEKLRINGIDISTLQFGVADYATVPVGGVLGIGFPRRESVKGYDNAPNEFYPNFPQVLKNEGVIGVAAYSMFLNEVSSDAGSILFGAVDPTKYTGSLYTFPMVNEYPNVVDKPATLAMTLQALGAKSDSSCKYKTFTTTKQAVLLDSGTTLMTAPPEIAEEMASFVGATYNESEGIFYFDCPSDDDDTEFIFDFGDLKITLPLASLVISSSGDGHCGFGLTPASYSMTLGAIFLSSAYVVYDLDNYQISIAQAKWDGNPSQKSRVRIPKDGTIYGATKATATPWTTDEPVKVDYDMFEDHSSCIASQNETNQTSSESSSSMTSPFNSTSLSLQVSVTSTTADSQPTADQTSTTLDAEPSSIVFPDDNKAVTIVVTATTTVASSNMCQCTF